MKKIKQRIKVMLVILLINKLLILAMNIKIRNDEIKRQNEEIIELKGEN